MALTSRPNAEAIKAYMAKHEVGMYDAKQALFDEWTKLNMTSIKEMVALSTDTPMRLALLDLIELLEAAMDDW